MAVIKTIFKGESLSMLFTFPVAYDMARIEKHEVYIGETAFTGTVSGQTIALKLKSDDTGIMSGQYKVALWIDDSILGVKKPYLGDITIANTQAVPHNSSTSEVYDVIVNVDITVTSIDAGDLVFNYVKGDTGNYGVVEFVVNENMELEQHTLIGDPLNFAIVDDELVLNEAGQTVNLGSVTGSVTSVTYSEMTALIASSGLKVGARYIISDYQTVHTIPNTEDTNTGEVEPLLVTAITINQLANECYSLIYPQDIIYYDIENNQTMVAGCTKGYIYRRIDTKQNNDIPFDFRQVKFRRWQISQPTWIGSETYAKGAVVKSTADATLWMSLQDSNLNNTISDAAYWRQFEWDNLSYVACNSVFFPSDEVAWYLTPTANYQDYKMWANDAYYSSAYSNKIDTPLSDLITNTNSVIFGAKFYGNSIGANFYSNSIGAGFYSNSIGANFNYNSIGANFNYNSIGAGFYSNSIGAGFYSNSIGAGFNYNSIGANFNYNSIGANFNYNSIGAYFNYNSTSANIQSKDLSAAEELYNKSYPHELIVTNSGGVLIRWYNNIGVQQTQLIA